MTREQIVAALTAIERVLASRVTVVRVIVDEHGQPTGQRIVRGNFAAPADWRPPTFETLMSQAKNRRNHE